MATALADQLQRLATAETKSYKVDVRSRKSLVHTEQEAAHIDTVTCYESGLNSFTNLCKIDSRFERFSETLFHESSTRHVPIMLLKEDKDGVNREIDKFLALVSAHLALPGTLFAIEWLVYKFNIDLYNVEGILRCIFPFHETGIFPKFIQLFDFKSPSLKNWFWLESIAKTGVPLTKQEFGKMCMRDHSILLFMCSSVRKAVKLASGSDDSVLRLNLNLFTSTVIHLLMQPTKVYGLSHILSTTQDTIARGLKSPYVSYRAAVYTVIHCSIHKLPLNSRLTNDWIETMLKYPVEKMEFETAALISMICLTQESKLTIATLQEQFEALVARLPADKRRLIDQLQQKQLENNLGLTAKKKTETAETAMDVDEDPSEEITEKKKKKKKKSKNKDKAVPMEQEAETESSQNTILLPSGTLATDIAGLITLWTGGSCRTPTVDQIAEMKALISMHQLVEQDTEKTVLTPHLHLILANLLPILVYPNKYIREKSFSIITDIVASYQVAGLEHLVAVRPSNIKEDHQFLLQLPYTSEILSMLGPVLQPVTSPLTCGQFRVLSAALSFLTPDTLPLTFTLPAFPGSVKPDSETLWSALLNLIGCKQNDVCGPVIARITSSPGMFAAFGTEVSRLHELLDAFLLKGTDYEVIWTMFKKLPLTVDHIEYCLKKILPNNTGTEFTTVREKQRQLRSSCRKNCSVTHKEETVKEVPTEESFHRLNAVLQILEASPKLDETAWRLVRLLIDHLKSCLTLVRMPTLPNLDLSLALDQMEVDEKPSLSPPSNVLSTVHQLLACLLTICRIHDSTATTAQEHSLTIDPILTCLTAFVDRQIHQQVLFLVTEMARLFPFLVVHNLVNLVTFIGQRVLPLDDSHSLHVLSRLVATALPACVRSSPQPSLAMVRVLAVLADCRRDIPPHRRLVCFQQLIQGMMNDWEAGIMWALVLLLMAKKMQDRSPVKTAVADMDDTFLVQLACKLSISDQLHTWTTLLAFLRFVDDSPEAGSSVDLETSTTSADDSVAASPAQKRRRTLSKSAKKEVAQSDNIHPLFPAVAAALRSSLGSDASSLALLSSPHRLTLSCLSLLRDHLASPGHLTQLAEYSEGQLTGLMPAYAAFMHQLVQTVVAAAAKGHPRSPLLYLLYEILHKIHATVPGVHYIDALASLLSHPTTQVRRKSLDLLHTKLVSLTPQDCKGWTDTLLAALPLVSQRALIGADDNAASSSTEMVRRTGIVCAKEMVRLLNGKYIQAFDSLISTILSTDHLSTRCTDPETQSLVLLLLAECVRQWGDAMVPRLDTLIPLSLRLIDTQMAQLAPEGSREGTAGPTPAVWAHMLAYLSPIHQLCEPQLAPFISPFLLPVLGTVFLLDDRIQDIVPSDLEAGLLKQMASKTKFIRNSISKALEARTLFPVIKDLVLKGSNPGQWYLLSGAMSLLRRHIRHLADDIFQLAEETHRGWMWNLLNAGLSLRSLASLPSSGSGTIGGLDATKLETLEVDCLKSLAGCLARLVPDSLERQIRRGLGLCRQKTGGVLFHIPLFKLLYFLSSKLSAESYTDLIRTLGIVEFMTQLLNQVSGNVAVDDPKKSTTPLIPLNTEDPDALNQLIIALLQALSAFLEAEHATSGALPAYDVTLDLIPALVSLLDTVSLVPYATRCTDHLIPCFRQLTRSAGGDEALLKPLQHAICLRTKAEESQVRLSAVEALRTLFDELGEIYLTSLLPEALPFLAECLEDDNRDVEAEARKLYAAIETQLGEPIAL